MELVYGERYRIRRTNNEIIEGTLIQTKGDDENYPTFELGTGGRIGVHRDAVLGLSSDVAPHGGIPRVVAIDSDADGAHIHFSAIEVNGDETCEDCENTHYLYVREYGACGCSCHSKIKTEVES